MSKNTPRSVRATRNVKTVKKITVLSHKTPKKAVVETKVDDQLHNLIYDMVLAKLDDIENDGYQTKYMKENKNGEIIMFHSYAVREGKRRFSFDYGLKVFLNKLISCFIETLNNASDLSELTEGGNGWTASALNIIYASKITFKLEHFPTLKSAATKLRSNILSSLSGDVKEQEDLLTLFVDCMVSIASYLAPLTNKVATILLSDLINYCQTVGLDPKNIEEMIAYVNGEIDNRDRELAIRKKQMEEKKAQKLANNTTTTDIVSKSDVDIQVTEFVENTNLTTVDGLENALAEEDDEEEVVDFTTA